MTLEIPLLSILFTFIKTFVLPMLTTIVVLEFAVRFTNDKDIRTALRKAGYMTTFIVFSVLTFSSINGTFAPRIKHEQTRIPNGSEKTIAPIEHAEFTSGMSRKELKAETLAQEEAQNKRIEDSGFSSKPEK